MVFLLISVGQTSVLGSRDVCIGPPFPIQRGGTKRGREKEDLKLKQAGANWQMAHRSKGDGDRILLKDYLAIELTKWFAIVRVQPSAGRRVPSCLWACLTMEKVLGWAVSPVLPRTAPGLEVKCITYLAPPKVINLSLLFPTASLPSFLALLASSLARPEPNRPMGKEQAEKQLRTRT